MTENLLRLTNQLLQYNQLFLQYYQEGRATGVTYDFHEVIKPFSNEVKAVTEGWNHEMKNWLTASSQKHLHLKQVEMVSEHIEQLSIQAFFPETSKSRFLNFHRTVDYFLKEVLKELSK